MNSGDFVVPFGCFGKPFSSDATAESSRASEAAFNSSRSPVAYSSVFCKVSHNAEPSALEASTGKVTANPQYPPA